MKQLHRAIGSPHGLVISSDACKRLETAINLVIRGGPIFLVSNGGDDDHGMIAAEEHDDAVEDNLYDATRSLDWSLSPMQQLSTLQDILNSTHLRT
jgi:hypothetical protein